MSVPQALGKVTPPNAAATFRSLFLAAGDLPREMRCVRDAREGDVAPPSFTENPAARDQLRAGWATWFAPPDAELYRVDDVRWLFTSEDKAQRWFDRSARHAARFTPAVPAVIGGAVHALVFGTPSTGYAHLVASQVLVARITAVPGEDAELNRDRVDALARITASRMAFYLANRAVTPVRHWWS